jgi:hypothetical protein
MTSPFGLLLSTTTREGREFPLRVIIQLSNLPLPLKGGGAGERVPGGRGMGSKILKRLKFQHAEIGVFFH